MDTQPKENTQPVHNGTIKDAMKLPIVTKPSQLGLNDDDDVVPVVAFKERRSLRTLTGLEEIQTQHRAGKHMAKYLHIKRTLLCLVIKMAEQMSGIRHILLNEKSDLRSACLYISIMAHFVKKKYLCLLFIIAG